MWSKKRIKNEKSRNLLTVTILPTTHSLTRSLAHGMDKYVKVKVIGEGAYGKALLVRHKVNNAQYVIKEVNIAKVCVCVCVCVCLEEE